MNSSRRSNDWGFPRWRGYESSRETTEVRICDRYGCDEPGDRPAPKSPNSDERWYFCEAHAGEYNRNYNYFEGLTEQERKRREQEERQAAAGFAEASHYGWAGPGDGTRSGDELRALDILGLDTDANIDEIKKAWRQLAKEHHPDVKPDDEEAVQKFAAGQAAWEVLRSAEERREWKGA